MLLTVDIGNSSIDFGVFDLSGNLLCRSKLSAVKSKCEDEYAVIINDILSLNGIDRNEITSSIVCSVVPSLTSVVTGSLTKLFGIESIIVGPGIRTGLNIHIDNHTQLGADLVANAVAANSMFNPPLVVIDAGTATTLTVIDRSGDLIGVIIAPGLRVSLDALSKYAAELPDVSLTTPKLFIGKNTEESMASGVIYGHAFMLDGFIERIRDEIASNTLCVVATGGLADSILPLCHEKIEYIPDLTMLGLRMLYIKNAK